MSYYIKNGEKFSVYGKRKIVIWLRNPTLTNREKNCRQGRFAAETRQSRGRQRIS
jgi:hypothetical protein